MIKEINLSYTRPQLEIFFDWPEGVRFKGVQKGRRFGATKGAANAIIEWCIEGISPILWGDTIAGNIDRYFERYFLPELKANEIDFHWNSQSKQLKIGKCFVDFRSADRPENWEGFGYKIIFLNEAGIILKDKYLYTNAVLPMLIDFPDSKLIAAGVPKGKICKDGSEHPFYSICSKKDDPSYLIHQYSSYDNPLLDEDDIKDLEKEIQAMNPSMVAQEIYGEFIDSDAENPFAFAYDAKKHEHSLTQFDPKKQLIVSIDFNINPFSVIFAQIYQIGGVDCCYIFDEMAIKNGSIPEMVDRIKLKYGKYLSGCFLTGDSMGKNRNIQERDNASNYEQLRRGLGLSSAQLKLPHNPTHDNSRADCNYVLTHFPELKINPITCPGLCRDLKVVQCDVFGSIIKRNRKDISQLADFLDCFRSLVHTFLRPWIDRDMKKR